jgi:hypothetical protein
MGLCVSYPLNRDFLKSMATSRTELKSRTEK